MPIHRSGTLDRLRLHVGLPRFFGPVVMREPLLCHRPAAGGGRRIPSDFVRMAAIENQLTARSGRLVRGLAAEMARYLRKIELSGGQFNRRHSVHPQTMKVSIWLSIFVNPVTAKRCQDLGFYSRGNYISSYLYCTIDQVSILLHVTETDVRIRAL